MDVIQKYDRAQQLIADDPNAVAIIGNPQSGDFELLDIADAVASARSEGRSQAFVSRGMGFLGVFGIVDGSVRSALEVPLDNVTLDAIAAAFIRHVEQNMDAGLRARLEKTALEGWLSRLATEDGAPA